MREPDESEICAMAMFSHGWSGKYVWNKLVDKKRHKSNWGSDAEEEGEEAGFCVAGERLEDDECLRLHILGTNSLFLKLLSYMVLSHDLILDT